MQWEEWIVLTLGIEINLKTLLSRSIGGAAMKVRVSHPKHIHTPYGVLCTHRKDGTTGGVFFWDNKKWSLILIKNRERNLHLSDSSGIAIAMGLKTVESERSTMYITYIDVCTIFVQPSRGASSLEPLFSPQCNVYAPFSLFQLIYMSSKI